MVDTRNQGTPNTYPLLNNRMQFILNALIE